MHKSLDLGYHIPESYKSFYPSLMSPLKVFELDSTCSTKTGIFERLQADTELRLRARLNSRSTPKFSVPKSNTPIEEILIRKGKERQNRIRNLCEQEEIRKAQELQEKPLISHNSKMIMKNKYRNSGKSIQTRPNSQDKLFLSSEYEENDTERNRKLVIIENLKNDNLSFGQDSGKIISQDNLPVEVERKSLQSQSSRNKSISANYDKNPGKVPYLDPYTNRNYVPMFTKPVDINRLLRSKVKRKTEGASSSININNFKNNTSQKRPIVRPISEASIKVKQPHQQSLQNRISKGIELLKKKNQV
jgi:hypothetical protein